MKKMLVNLMNTTRDGIPVIWLIKLKKWEELGFEIHIQTGLFIKQISLKGQDVYRFNENFKELEAIPEGQHSKLGYIWYALKRNVSVFKNYQKIRDSEYDVIYTPSSVLEFVLFPCFYRTLNNDIKWVTELHNTVPLKGPGNKIVRVLAWLFFKISIFTIRSADIVYAITPSLKDYLVNAGFKDSRVVLTGFAVETDKIKAAVCDNNYHIDALFVGRINEKKGIYDMLKILSMVKKDIPDFQLAIMGDGDPVTISLFKKKITDLVLESNVQFLGYKTGAEKYNIIKTSKFFWFFSYDESFGVALLEAVCLGKPALVYDLPVYHRLYSNNEIMAFDKYDYSSIADQTVRLYKTHSFENFNGKLLISKYSWDKIVEVEYNALTNKI